MMGCREAVKNGATGLLGPPRNVEALARVLGRLIENPALRLNLGRNTTSVFKREVIWRGLDKQYHKLLSL
jgi:glycosyltransferase involved in cell wall biosynthesis